MTTKVVFRKAKDGTVVALFPEQPESISHPHRLVTTYVHLGQHGAAQPDQLVWDTKPATEEEYADLLKELEELVGYEDLEIYQKITPQMRAERERRWNEIMGRGDEE